MYVQSTVYYVYAVYIMLLVSLRLSKGELSTNDIPRFQFTGDNSLAWLKGRINHDKHTWKIDESFIKDDDVEELEWQKVSVTNDKLREFRLSRKFLFRVTEQDVPNENITESYKMELVPALPFFNPEICLSLKDALWYGGSELHHQRWPLGNVSLPMQPFVTNDIVLLKSSFGNVIERFWLNSKGVGIFVDEDVPLFVSFNGNNSSDICLRAAYTHPFSEIKRNDLSRAKLTLTVVKAKTIKDVFSLFANERIKLPSGIPDIRMIKSPIWSTWAKYKVDIDDEKIMKYADEILQHGFCNSQLEIDDMFSTHYGAFNFCPKKFKDPKAFIEHLKSKGFRVTVWITPFANMDSEAFTNGLNNSYWLTDTNGNVPSLVKWWQGIGGTLDVTNEAAVKWFIDRLTKMKQDYGVDSFKFDAGEVTYLPASYRVSDVWNNNPCTYTTQYVETVSRMGPMIEVRCGYRTQQYPVFVRMGDKESRWGHDNGLRSIIPTVLTFGILGYPYVLPDMIGGNGYTPSEDGKDIVLTETVLPDRELYIRWLELTAYLPAMQFSFVPWQYDEDVVTLAQTYVKIHEDIVTPILIEAAELVQITGAPLIRPLWWIAPEDMDALECDDEFLVGDSLLVAPVLEKGARARNIYLPAGVWEDGLTGKTLVGKMWLHGYAADLNQVPTFKRVH